MDKTESSSSQSINFRIIDWMRGLAALYVVVQHARGYLFVDSQRYEKVIAPKTEWHWWEWLNTIVVQHTNLGKEFVTVFFVLSGFCIMHSVTAEKGGIKNYFLRRLVRVYPTYVLGIVWGIAAFLILKAVVPSIFSNVTEGYPPLRDPFDAFLNIKALVLNLVYMVQDNAMIKQYWSLPLEIVFYLCIPFFAKHFRVYTVFTITTFIAGICWTGLDYLDEQKYSSPLVVVRYIFDYNIYFYMGCLFYKYKDFFLSIFKMDAMRSLVAMLLIFLLSVFVKSYLFEQSSNKANGLMMVLFTYIMVMAGLKHQMRIGWLEWVGGFSYTLYISHIATLYLIKLGVYKLGYNFYDIYPVYIWYLGIPLTVLVAWILYYIAEYPSKMYLKHLRAKPVN